MKIYYWVRFLLFYEIYLFNWVNVIKYFIDEQGDEDEMIQETSFERDLNRELDEIMMGMCIVLKEYCSGMFKCILNNNSYFIIEDGEGKWKILIVILNLICQYKQWLYNEKIYVLNVT